MWTCTSLKKLLLDQLSGVKLVALGNVTTREAKRRSKFVRLRYGQRARRTAANTFARRSVVRPRYARCDLRKPKKTRLCMNWLAAATRLGEGAKKGKSQH